MIQAITRTEGWTTSDGKFFVRHVEAANHERMLILVEAIRVCQALNMTPQQIAQDLLKSKQIRILILPQKKAP